MTADQAARLLAAAEADEAMRAYVVVSLLTGARTEELRALTWTHVDLEGKPPTVALWRSVRAGGETKTRQSRRTLELPARAAEALRAHRTSQRHARHVLERCRIEHEDVGGPGRAPGALEEALAGLLTRYRAERRDGEAFHQWARRLPNAELRATLQGGRP